MPLMICELRAIFAAAFRAAMFRPSLSLPAGRVAVAVTALAFATLTSVAVELFWSPEFNGFDAAGLTYTIAAWAIFAVGLSVLRTPDRAIDVAAIVALSAAVSVVFCAIWVIAGYAALGAAGLLGAQPVALFVVVWLLMYGPFFWMLAALSSAGRSLTRGMARRGLGFALPALVVLPMLVLPFRSILAGSQATATIPTIWDMAEYVLPEREFAASPMTHRASVDVEATWDQQPELVARALADVAPSRAGVPEVYFIGAALYSGQDVFKREVASARQIVEERLGSKARSLLLINHREFSSQLPMANATNLDKAISGVGRIMDREKDVLVVFLTSHGSDGSLSVSYPRFGLNDLTPERLAGMLERAQIKNRVVIISACHSGSFIPALATANTLVITAAHANKTSFGCSNEREWTYFGDALFNHALRQTASLPEAFAIASRIVAGWETARGLTPSEPQMAAGAEILTVLGTIGTSKVAADIASGNSSALR